MLQFSELVPVIVADPEKATYLAKAELKKVRTAFEREELYPHLKEAAAAHNRISEMLEEAGRLEAELEKHLDIKRIDFSAGEIIHEDLEAVSVHVVTNFLGDLLQELKVLVDKGKEVFDAVEAGLVVDFLGPTPHDIRDGFMLLHQDCFRPLEDDGSGHYVMLYEKQRIHQRHHGVSESYHALRTEDITLVPSTCSFADIRNHLRKEEVIQDGDALLGVTSARQENFNFSLEKTVKPVSKRLAMSKLAEA